MAKIDLDTLGIEELATLSYDGTQKLSEKVAARQAELEVEPAALARCGNPACRASADPRGDGRSKEGAAKDVVTKAAATKAA